MIVFMVQAALLGFCTIGLLCMCLGAIYLCLDASGELV